MERFKLIPGVHLLLIEDGKVLMLKRSNTGSEDGNYGVPAGYINGGESVTIAMAREAFEKIGITVAPRDLRIVHVMHRKMKDSETIDFFLSTSVWHGLIENKEADKCDAIELFPFGGLPENTIPYIKTAIEKYRKKIAFSEFGWE